MHASVLPLKDVLPLALDVFGSREPRDVLRPALAGRLPHGMSDAFDGPVFVERSSGAKKPVEGLRRALESFCRLEDILSKIN